MDEEEKKITFKIPKINPWMITTLILAILCLILVTGWPVNLTGRITGSVIESGGVIEALTAEEAANKAIDYLNELGYPCILVSVKEFSGDPNLYEVTTSIQGQQIPVYVTKNGRFLFSFIADTSQEIPQQQQAQEVKTIGNFLVSDDPVCTEDGKPIIYFFGSSGCPHCNWEHPIVESVATNFEEYISFHNNMDSNEDEDVFSRYSTGGVPTIVLGCKYYRIGSGESIGEGQESKVLTALICKLTNNQPENVCTDVQDLIAQITET